MGGRVLHFSIHIEPTLAPENPTRFAGYHYSEYMDKTCESTLFEPVGCYNTKKPFVRGTFLINWRMAIEWKRIGAFGSSMACACADAARATGAKLFGLHFWGECWALEESEIVFAPKGDCTLCDGTYKTKCLEKGHRTDFECLGYESYYVYKVM